MYSILFVFILTAEKNNAGVDILPGAQQFVDKVSLVELDKNQDSMVLKKRTYINSSENAIETMLDNASGPNHYLS